MNGSTTASARTPSAGFSLTLGDQAFLAFAALYLLALRMMAVLPPVARDIVNVAFFGAAVFTIVAQWQNADDPNLDPATRRVWQWLAAASGMLFVSGGTWTTWAALHHQAVTPEWSDWLALAYVPLAIVGYRLVPRDPRVSARDPRVLLDIALLVVGGVTLSWHFSVRLLLERTNVPIRAVDVVNIIGDWAVYLGAAAALIRSRSRILRTAISINLAAHLFATLSDYAWVNATAYRPGDAIDAFWFGTWVLRWAAARHQWHAGRRPRVGNGERWDGTYRSGIAPTLVVAFTYTLLVKVVLTGDADTRGIIVVATLLTLLLLVRQRAELTANQSLSQTHVALTRRFQTLLSNASDYIIVIDPQLRLRWVSPSLGFLSAAERVAPFADLVHPDDRAFTLRWLVHSESDERAPSRQCRVRGADGWMEVELRVEDRRNDPSVGGFVINGRDLAAEHALEGRLRHAAKLTTLHDIAGRIAHAFNNLLAMISGHAELLATDLADDPSASADIAAIRAAADRGAGITRQLLGFTGSHVIQAVQLPVTATIDALAPALVRTLPQNIRLDLALNAPDAHVLFDRSQFEQVLLNLVINARDAMPKGGVIRIAAVAELFDADRDVVVIRVHDDGTGIPAESLHHIFEPFFTTKAPGMGTGLGLAMVDTIVRRASGRVAVESTEGRGTTVSLHLPRTTAPAQTILEAPTAPSAAPRRGTVLLVDDETGVRRVSRRMLERAGYAVIEAGGGAEAIALAAQPELAIDILVTDMMMPDVSGHDVIERFVTLRPATPIIVVTGFAAEGIDQSPLDPAVKAILAKPFNAKNFIRIVSAALTGKDEPSDHERSDGS